MSKTSFTSCQCHTMNCKTFQTRTQGAILGILGDASWLSDLTEKCAAAIYRCHALLVEMCRVRTAVAIRLNLCWRMLSLLLGIVVTLACDNSFKIIITEGCVG